MDKKNKSSAVVEMLKKGLSVKQIKERMAVSESYIYLAKKKLEDMANEVLTAAEKTTTLSVDNTVYADITPEFAFSLSQGRQKRKEAEAIDELLTERATTYGSFEDVAGCAQEIKNAIRMCNNSELDDDQIEALDMIASKIARVVNGDSNHIDSWIDIAGYATLVADRLQGKIR